jgi:hypothetical protein
MMLAPAWAIAWRRHDQELPLIDTTGRYRVRFRWHYLLPPLPKR